MVKFLLTDTSGSKSVTLTVFVLGAIVVNLKLILSGLVIHGLALAPFGGGEYAAAMAALGGIYVLRRSTSNNNGSSGDVK